MDQGEEILDGGVEIVPGIRRVRATVAALIDRDHRVTTRVEVLGDTVPEAKIRRQSVDENEGDRGRLPRVLLDLKTHTRCDLETPLERRCPRAIVWRGHMVTVHIAHDRIIGTIAPTPESRG